MEKYADALAEVAVILDYLEDNDYNKIPKDVIEIIEKYKNEDYIFEYNEDVELKNQELLTETKAILYNFFRDYWANPKQQEKIKQWQREDRIKTEIKKQEEYEYKELFPNKKVGDLRFENITENNKQLIECKENIFKKIVNKIKEIFTRKSSNIGDSIHVKYK